MYFRELFGLAADPSATYVAQAMLGLAMFFIFRHFSLVYERRFLRTWSRSWLAFSIFMIASVILMTNLEDDNSPSVEWLLVSTAGPVASFLPLDQIRRAS